MEIGKIAANIFIDKKSYKQQIGKVMQLYE